MDANNYEIGTFEWFVTYFWPINPIGSTSGANAKSAYYYAERCIGDMLADGSFLTWEELLKRYTDFYNYMQSQQNGVYTKKEFKMLTIEEYISKKQYQSDYSKIQENTCDAYLFGI